MSEEKDGAQRRLRARRDVGEIPREGDVYRHHAGGLYTIVCVSIGQANLDTLVTYHSNLKGTRWTHTLEDFSEDVGGRPRFAREPG